MQIKHLDVLLLEPVSCSGIYFITINASFKGLTD